MAVQRSTRKKRVAVIGSGLAGLSAAHLLTRENDDDDGEGIEVHIFEKAQAIGMDSASIDVVGNDGQIHRVDSPMRAVQGGYYTRLLKLYKSLGIELEKSNFTYSFFELSSKPSERKGYTAPYHRHRSSREDHHKQHKTTKSHGLVDEKGLYNTGIKNWQASKTTTFLYNGGNGISLRPIGFPLNGYSFKYIFRHLYLTDLIYHFYDIIKTISKATFFASCYIYLLFLSFYHVYLGHTPTTSSHPLSKRTLSTFLLTTYLPRSFINEIMIPLFACVATCSPGEIMEYPAGEILEYIAKTFGTDHYIVKGGVRNAVQRLLKDVPSENIHLGCELVSLIRLPLSKHHANGQCELLELKEVSGKTWEFDNVIFATQANQARFLLAGYYKALRDSESPLDNRELTFEKERLDALGRFSYTQSIVVNHYDSKSTLVKDVQDRRILNLARWSDEDINLSLSSRLVNEDEKLDSTKRMKQEYTMATHNLSILHPNCKSPSSTNEVVPLLQTTNPTIRIEESLIVSSQVFERAILTLDSKDALKRFMRYPAGNRSSSSEENERDCFQGLGGIYFVGAWAAEGIPLLEGCVVSAERAVQSLCG